MLIYFKCNKCGVEFSKKEEEIITENLSYRFCSCGGNLSIQNIEQIVKQDVDQWLDRDFFNALNCLGVEGTIEAIEHLQNQKVKELYQDKLRKKGLVK